MQVNFDELLEQGQFEAAFEAAKQGVRERPNDVIARGLFFTLLCYQGAWDRAYQHLQAWAPLDPKAVPLLIAFERLLAHEKQRHAVLTGKAPVPISGAVTGVDAQQAEVLRLWCAGRHAESAKLREGVEGVGLKGTLDGKAFEGLEDFDSRFGGLLEVFLPEGYQLVALSRIRSLKAELPRTHLDLMWKPVLIEFADDTLPAHLPTRYPGSETSEDSAVRLGRKTEFGEPFPDFFTLTGQRLLVMAEPETDVPVVGIQALRIGEGPAPESSP